ncbi:MAG: dienelactone hydrolase family protein [Woeseiaceae bacterium]
MSVKTRLVDYDDGQVNYQGMLAFDDARAGAKPGVLVAHTIRGRTAFEERKAQALAELGYAALAIDVYGKTELRTDDENTRSQMNALKADREKLGRRLALALEVLNLQPEVDASQTAAIGFCFGGLCVLDLARSDEQLAGVVSFHGLLDAPENWATRSIDTKVLVLHGWEDPMATPDSVLELSREMSAAGADWQVHAYGNTVHAFTNPAASDTTRGTVYDAAADRRSWVAMTNFLDELFSG